MLRILKFFGFLLLGVLCALLVAWWVLDEDVPEASTSPQADKLAKSMMQAVNASAWDNIPIIQWTFKGVHTFQWDKVNHLCLVTWDTYTVKLDIDKKIGKAYRQGELLPLAESLHIIEKAWDFFNNDSFWLNAVVKAFDEGTSRSLVKLKHGQQGLMIHYSSGGTTPGDSYVWILDENRRPIAWKMWVKILPLGGMEFSWEDWITLPGGAQIATNHKSSAVNLDISNVKAAQNWSELGYLENPLLEIME